MNEFKPIGVSIDTKLLKAIDTAMPKTDSISRSEFICDAISYYLSMLNAQDTERVLTPALESSIRAAVKISEQKMTGLMFKQAVEIEMMMQIVAASHNITRDALRELRKVCVEDVKRTNGRISIDDVVERQGGLR